jgi:hypothetical protein
MKSSTPTNFVLASQDGCDVFEKEINQILHALGHADALVTDESQVGDFCIHLPVMDEEVVALNRQTLEDVSAVMGRPVEARECLWELGRELAERQATPTVH